MTLTLRIEHSDGTTTTLEILGPDNLGDTDRPSLASIRIDRSLVRGADETDTAECTVHRDAWQEALTSIDAIDDKFYINDGTSDIFGGRLEDHKYQGATASVVLHGPKSDALGAEPSTGTTSYAIQSDDSLVTNNLLPRAPTISAGTVTQQTASIGFETAHASPGAAITKLAEAAGAEVIYRPDWTLDYVGSLGSDRTGDTLSPGSQTVIGEPRVQRQQRDDYTHIRVLGNQNGSAQFSAERTLDGSTTNEQWGVFTEKEAQSQSRLEALADQLETELTNNPEHIEVSVSVPASVAPSLGDTFTVTLPAYDIDATLRVLSYTRTFDESGELYSCLLSNRQRSREVQGARQARNIEAVALHNPGQYYAINTTPVYDPVDSATDYGVSFYRPENTITELRAVLRVLSRPYRLRASGESHSHDVSISVPSHNHGVDIPLPDHIHGIEYRNDVISLTTTETDSHTHEYDIPYQTSLTEDATSTSTTSDDGGSYSTTETSDSVAPLAAGINETTKQVSNVSVSVNGTTLTSGLAAPVDARLDITGEFSDGRNDITITSDSLGEIAAVVEYEGVKNVQ